MGGGSNFLICLKQPTLQDLSALLIDKPQRQQAQSAHLKGHMLFTNKFLSLSSLKQHIRIRPQLRTYLVQQPHNFQVKCFIK